MSRSSAWAARLGVAAWAVATAWLGLLGSAPAPERGPLPERIAVEWGHCTSRTQGPVTVCVYDPEDPVRIWIDHPRASEAQVRIDGVELEPERYRLVEEPHDGGLRVRVPPGSTELVLDVPTDQGAWVALGLLLQQKDPVVVEQWLAPYHELQEAWATRDVDTIESATQAMGERFVTDGWISQAIMLFCATSFMLREQRAFEAAVRALERAEALGSEWAEDRKNVAAYRGQLAWAQGALHDALVPLRESTRLSLRLEDPLGLADALPIYAVALAEHGYYAEAAYWARRMREYLPRDTCDRASVLRTIGWIHLLLRAREQDHDDPRPQLEQAIELYREGESCAYKQGGARLSLALLAFGDGDVATARRELEAIDVTTLFAEDRVRAADLRVRLRLRTDADTAAAWQAWHELEAAARVVDDDDARWRVEVRRGELLVRSGDAPAALAALGRAEGHLDRLVRAQAVVGVGRTATADRYLEGTTALVSLLVEQREVPRAFCVARQARARRRSAARGLDGLPAAARAEVEQKIRRYREQKALAEETEALVLERPQAQEPALRHEAAQASRAASELVDEIVEQLVQASASPRCDELAAPAPGELLVGLYPRTDDWLVIAHDGRGTSAHAIATPSDEELAGDPAALAKRLLEPVAAVLDGATRVRVLADREAQTIDVHLLPWRGAPLSAKVPVTYGVELPASPITAPADPPRALVLADPTGTLASARAEVHVVEERLAQAGWEVVAPITDDPNAPIDVSFAGYSLLHYAAHTATRQGPPQVWAPYPAGEAGGLPHLQIGPMARLEVHDILALRPVPPVAFLAGCKTGLVELDAGSTSVALAFLLADGQQVVASSENVDDAQALDVARRFYARFGRGAGMDAAVAMHEVQQELWQAGEPVAPYRVWVR